MEGHFLWGCRLAGKGETRVGPGSPAVGSKLLLDKDQEDFSGGAVFKNPPANAGDTGLIPGLGRSHMPQSN